MRLRVARCVRCRRLTMRLLAPWALTFCRDQERCVARAYGFEPIAKRGGYQPRALGAPPTKPPPR